MKKLFIFTMILVAVLFSSCYPHYYAPAKQNIMPFDEKGDITVSATIGTLGEFGADAGWAITDNIGIYSSFNYIDISNFENTHNSPNDFVWDNELVFYKWIKNRLYAGVNVGIGIGEIGMLHPYYDLKLNRQYIQPTFGLKVVDPFILAFSFRVSRVDYSLKSDFINYSEYDENLFRKYFFLGDVGKSDFFFFEPAFTWGVDSEFMKYRFQLSLAKQLNKADINFRLGLISASAALNIDKLFFRPYDRTKKLRWKL